jgi:hypothetical protein
VKLLRFLPLLLLVGAIAAAGCGTTSDDTATTTIGVTTTTIGVTTTTIGATTTTDSQVAISDGEYFGFVRQVAADALVFDPAELLSGEAAVAAARADGAIGPTEELPNDFYIRNPEKEEVRLEVHPSARFTLIGLTSTGELADEVVSLGELAKLWSGADDTSQYYGFAVGELPMTLIVSDGAVTEAAQQYLP